MTNDGNLLHTVIEAHGGLTRWQSARELVIRARSGGFAFAMRFKPRAFHAYEVRVSTTEPRAIFSPFSGSGRRGVFEGDEVRIESDDGTILVERTNARAAFHHFRQNLWWDNLDALYFGGYALWNYLCVPFLFVRPGFEVREIESWEENGESWRRLHVIFPPHLPTHSREQVFYFNSAGLLRRIDYTAEVFGKWAKAVHYCWEHKEFSGLVVPTRRRVFPRTRTGRSRGFPTLIWIDIDEVMVVED